MSRLDILKSLARSAARTAGEQLGSTDLRAQLRKRVENLSMFQASLDDAQLTRAIGRAPGVAAATLQIDHGVIRIELTDSEGRDASLQLRPGNVSFAPHGAKEIGFAVSPPEVAEAPMAAEIVGAVAGEVARALWGPFLAGARRSGAQHSTHSAFVHRAGSVLTADLRTVPEVRAVLGQRLPAALLDALKLERLEAVPGQLQLRLGVHGLPL